MLYRSVRLAYVLCAVLGLLLATLAFNAYDELDAGAPDHQVRLDDNPTGASSAEVAAVLSTTAGTTRGDIGRLVFDLESPQDVSHVYVAVGDPHGKVAGWVTDGYRGFSRATDVRFHDLAQMGPVDPRGYYLVWGGQDAADALLRAAQGLGMTGEVAPYAGLADIPAGLGYGPLAWSAVVSLLAVVVLVGAGVVMAAPAYGVQRLQGRSFLVILARDVREVVRRSSPPIAVVVALAAVALWFYNGGARWDEYLRVVGAVVGALFAAAFVAHVGALALVARSPILAAVKGEYAFRWALAAMYLVRVPAMLLVVTVTFGAVTVALQVQEHEAARAQWRAEGDAAFLLFGGQVAGDPADDARAGAMVRQAGQDGAAVLVADVTDFMVPVDPADPMAMPEPSCDVLVVNPSYLDRHPVLDDEGGRVAVPAGDVTLLRPSGCGADVVTGSRLWIDQQAALSGTASPGIDETAIVGGQRHFTYGDGDDAATSTNVTDAALLVVPEDSGVLSDLQYMAWASTGDAVMLSADDAARRVAEAGLGDYVIGIQPAAQAAADQHRDLVQDLRLAVVASIGVLAVVVVTALGVAAVQVRRSAQVVFVRYLTGWPFLRMHRGFLVAETVLAVGTVAWTWRATGQIGPLGLPDVVAASATAWQLTIATGVAAAGLALVALLTRRGTRRLVASRSADA